MVISYIIFRMWSESLYIYFCVHQLPDDLSLLPVEMQEVEERRSEVEVGRGLFESLTIRENAKVPYSGKLSREKTFAFFAVSKSSAKVLSAKFRG